MKKVLGSIICILVITVLMISMGSTLKVYTTDTYVLSQHPDEIYYYGFVGVRGADHIYDGAIDCWPKYSRITYQVPYEPDHVKQVTASCMDDISARTGYIRVRDTPDWLAPKTKAFWQIPLEARPTNPGDPIPDRNLD